MFRNIRTVILASLAAASLSACAAPTAQNTAQSLAAEQRQSQKLVAQMEAKNAIIKDRGLNNYVNGIVNKIAQQRAPGSVPLRSYIVKDGDVNAFTTGGGYLFFNAGMLANMENEAQLAAVTAHEIAHIDRGHIQAGQSNRQTVQVLGGLASIAGAVAGVPGAATDLVVGLGSQAAVSSFSRTQETDADETGVRYLARAGYNAVEGARSFAVLNRLYGGQQGAASFFASHPASAERQANLTRMAQQLGATKGRIGKQSHDNATRALRKDALKYYEQAGRTKEAQQVRRNLRN